jgi:hypothetical protein
MILIVLSRAAIFGCVLAVVILSLILDRFFARCSADWKKEKSEDNSVVR